MYPTIEYRGTPPKKPQLSLAAAFFGAAALGFLGGLGVVILATSAAIG